jgi:Ca-activated chloride channel family protein
VTAFYEVVPVGAKVDVPSVDPLKYQQPTATTSAAYTDELLTLKLRYKAPESDTSQLISTPVADSGVSWSEASSDFRFAASVAAFGMVLRKSANVGTFGLQNVVDLALPEVGDDVAGYRREFVALVRKAQTIEGKPKVR